MKIYVAGKYSEREKIRLVFSQLELMGHTITVDWTNHDVYPNDAAKLTLGQFAYDDVSGVLEADIFIACMLNEHVYKGLWVEMGVALGANKPIYIVGPAGNSCIFTNHKNILKFKSFNELYDFLGLATPNKEETNG